MNSTGTAAFSAQVAATCTSASTAARAVVITFVASVVACAVACVVACDVASVVACAVACVVACVVASDVASVVASAVASVVASAATILTASLSEQCAQLLHELSREHRDLADCNINGGKHTELCNIFVIAAARNADHTIKPARAQSLGKGAASDVVGDVLIKQHEIGGALLVVPNRLELTIEYAHGHIDKRLLLRTALS